jgi:hypothetical protein
MRYLEWHKARESQELLKVKARVRVRCRIPYECDGEVEGEEIIK